MSERWWRRQRRGHPWFSDFIEESNGLERMRDEAVSQTSGSSEKRKSQKPYAFGFPMNPSPDGNLRFRRFGNWEPNCFGSEFRGEREPLVDVVEVGREIVVVAELPGVRKEDIQINASQRCVSISIDTLERKYHKELTLPVETDPESAVATYKNGVLQVRLKKLVCTRLFSE